MCGVHGDDLERFGVATILPEVSPIARDENENDVRVAEAFLFCKETLHDFPHVGLRDFLKQFEGVPG